MRALSVRLPRIFAVAVPIVAAMTLTACGNLTGPGDAQPRQVRADAKTTALGLTPQLSDSNRVRDDSTARGPVQPWY